MSGTGATCSSLRLTIETVLKNALEGANDGASLYLSSLHLRSLYLGQVKGMLAMCDHDDFPETKLVNRLEAELDRAVQSGQDEEMTRCIMLLTALFISLPGRSLLFSSTLSVLNEKVLRLLVWAPLRNFTDSTLSLCVLSWSWLLAARKDVDSRVRSRH